MDTIAVFIIFFAALLVSILKGVSLLVPLVLGLVCFTAVSLRRGYSLKALLTMMLGGAQKALLVVKIFVLIGTITAVWRASGTIAAIVYYGVMWLNAQYFILSAFLLCSLVSFLLGTSFGTVGTIGVVLMVMAKSGSVDVNVAAGAIIAGAFFGDRCSPMSSSANLVAVLTETGLYRNISNMVRTSLVPMLLACAGYIYLSWLHPLQVYDESIGQEIIQLFRIDAVVLLPALLILVLAACKVDVKLSMGISILSGMILSWQVQQVEFIKLLEYIVTGYQPAAAGPFAAIIKGGGLMSMLNVSLIVLISSAYFGIFEGTALLKDVEAVFERLSETVRVYPGMMITSIAAAAFGCNQTLAVMLTCQLQQKIYRQQGLTNYQLALDLENTVIMISALIPWNIAGAFPAAALAADAGCLVFALYLYLVPLANLYRGRSWQRA